MTLARTQSLPYHPYLSLPDGWDVCWKAAKAAAGSTPARLMFFGDSIAAGSVSPSDWKNAYPMLIRTNLAGRLGGSWGDYFPAFGYSPISNAQLPGTPPWSAANAGATVTQNNQFGWHRAAYDTAATEPTTYYFQTFTSPFNCTSMDLFYVDFTSGTWKHSIDGGADTTVTGTNGSVAATTSVKKISSGALASGIHTWAYGKQSASGVHVMQGVATYYGQTGGLACALMNNGSDAAVDYNSGQQTQFPTKRQRLLAGVNPQTDATANTALGFGFPTAPHCAIIEFGINDIISNSNTGLFFDALTALCCALRAGQPNCSILFHIPCNPDVNSSDGAGLNGTTPNNTGTKWHQYMQYLHLLARIFNAAVLNTHAKWGETPVGQGFLTVPNTVHPTDAGHLDIATDLIPIL